MSADTSLQNYSDTYNAPPQPVTLAWVLRRLLLCIAILFVTMGTIAWLLHATIDPTLDATHRQQFAEPVNDITTGSIKAVNSMANGGATAGSSIAAPAAVEAIREKVLND